MPVDLRLLRLHHRQDREGVVGVEPALVDFHPVIGLDAHVIVELSLHQGVQTIGVRQVVHEPQLDRIRGGDHGPVDELANV